MLLVETGIHVHPIRKRFGIAKSCRGKIPLGLSQIGIGGTTYR